MKKPKRLSKKVIQEDNEAFAALQAIDGYNPSNPEFTLANVTASNQTMTTKQTEEVQKQAVADAARDAAADAEWERHNKMLGAKTQVKAQFGEDSDEYASMGMKKKSEYKRGRRKASNNNAPTT